MVKYISNKIYRPIPFSIYASDNRWVTKVTVHTWSRNHSFLPKHNISLYSSHSVYKYIHTYVSKQFHSYIFLYVLIRQKKKSSFMALAVEEINETSRINQPPQQPHLCYPCKSFGRKCNHLVKNQRARFYILRRCIVMLLCWHEHS